MLGKKNLEYDARFELDEEPVVENNNPEKGSKKEKTKKIKTGSKVGKTVSTLALIGALGLGAFATGGFLGHGPLKGLVNLTESGRAKSLVAEYTDEDYFCSLPEEMLINKAYDINYASGEKLVANLNKKGVKYCEVFNEYYTPNGENIAILTYDVKTLDVLPAIKVNVGLSGAEVYMPVEGYTLDGNMCYKEGSEQLIKVVPVSVNGDYSNVSLDKDLTKTSTITGASLINVEEVATKTYESILDMTLICDVPDGAVLNESNQCVASFNLVPKTYKFTK